MTAAFISVEPVFINTALLQGSNAAPPRTNANAFLKSSAAILAILLISFAIALVISAIAFITFATTPIIPPNSCIPTPTIALITSATILPAPAIADIIFDNKLPMPD